MPTEAKVTELNVPTFQTGGFALSLGTFQIEQDSSPTQIFGLVGTDAGGNPIAGKVGDANPDFQMSFSNDIDFHRFTLGFLFDWKYGGDIINLTEFLYDITANSKDYLESGGGCGSDQPVWSGVQRSLHPERLVLQASGGESVLQSAGAVDLRPVRRRDPVRPAVSHRTEPACGSRPIVGLDPEVSNFANQAIVRNIDVAPFPPSRSFFFSIDLGF